MNINNETIDLIIDSVSRGLHKIDEEALSINEEKRNYFVEEFSAQKIKSLDKDSYFQGRGKKSGNFTYDLEITLKGLGSIRGGSVYKFGYEKDFDKIKDFLFKIISAKNEYEQFYTKEGELTKFSKEIIDISNSIKGVGRAMVGKVLSVYFPEIFLPIFGSQDVYLKNIYDDFISEYGGVELFLRNNLLLLNIKNKYVQETTNEEFSNLLWKIFGATYKSPNSSSSSYLQKDEDGKIDALEVQHYQSLIHRNFKILFKNKFSYVDPDVQNDISGHFDTQEVGIMDFLAKDEKGNFVVIELKRSSSDTTLGQILRYMGWVKSNLCTSSEKVYGIIIAENKDIRLDYALSIIKDVEFRKMELNVSIE